MRNALPESAGLSSERLALIAPRMRSFVDRGAIAGAITVIARHGQIVHFECHGYHDAEAGRPMAEDAVFGVFSMSKPVTAVATLMLHESGDFLLDDPIAAYIPELGRMKVAVGQTADGFALVDPERPVTIRHLLTHTSGIGYGLDTRTPLEVAYARAELMRRDETLAEKMSRLGELPLAFQPGTDWRYSFAIDVLGRLVEVISGQTLDVFLRERLFEPLGMVDAGFVVPPESQSRLVPIHTPSGDGAIRPIDRPMISHAADTRFFSGGGGLAMTAADYARFAQMLLNGGSLDGERILGRKTVELMARSTTPRDRIPVVPPDWTMRDGYGMALGVRTLVDPSASAILGSAGSYTWQGAASTDFWVDPAEDLFGVFMVQLLPGNYRPAETFRVLAYQSLQ